MIKKLAKCIREYKKASILTPACMILEVIFETVIPLLMTKIIDDGVGEATGVTNMTIVYVYGGIMIGLAVLALISGLGGAFFGARASAGLAKNLRSICRYNHRMYSYCFSSSWIWCN